MRDLIRGGLELSYRMSERNKEHTDTSIQSSDTTRQIGTQQDLTKMTRLWLRRKMTFPKIS